MQGTRTPLKIDPRRMSALRRSAASRRTRSADDDGEDDRPHGSILCGAAWASLCIIVGWVAGAKFGSPGFGYSMGAVAGFVVAQTKHKVAGAIGSIIAIVVLVSSIFIIEGMKSYQRAFHRIEVERVYQ